MYQRLVLLNMISHISNQHSTCQSTLCDSLGCSPPGSTVHGILQARILEWVAIPFSRGSSQPRDQTWAVQYLAPYKCSLPYVYFFFFFPIHLYHVSPSVVAQMVKNLPAMQETQVQTLGWEKPLEKEMATHSSILEWRIPWTEEPSGGLQSMGSQKIGQD